MCDVQLMKSKIGTLSRSGFNKRLKLSSSEAIPNLRALSRKIHGLVNDTRDVFMEIDEHIYAVLESPLELLISTLKDLLKEYQQQYSKTNEWSELRDNLTDLIELKSDIVNFRILAPKDSELQRVLKLASKMSA
ncbi:MAG: hypothetical protein LIP09_04005 [Bacteroidales bacterium]|nr:hypothetical protein [Bacteroidales bacterium]